MTDQSTIQFFTEVPETSLTEVFELIDQTAKNLKRIQSDMNKGMEAVLSPEQMQKYQAYNYYTRKHYSGKPWIKVYQLFL